VAVAASVVFPLAIVKARGIVDTWGGAVVLGAAGTAIWFGILTICGIVLTRRETRTAGARGGDREKLDRDERPSALRDPIDELDARE
jgi:hypothetical protein